MDSFSDDERDHGQGIENGGASDEDELMEDADGDPDDEEEEEAEAEAEEEEDEGDDDDENEDTTAAAAEPVPAERSRSPSRPLPSLRPGAATAATYDIVPYVAAPMSTSINAFCATPCMRWIFTGGADGYIRRFDWFGSMNGKVPLTVAQKHPFVDSVTRAGVLLSYWENEEPPVPGKTSLLHVPETTDDLKFSPVYSLAVHSQALWLLSGLESGGINLQSVRHDEGKIIHTLRGHNSAVSALTLSSDERSLLSGSWDRNAVDWDLNTGQAVRTFTGSAGQISSIEFRPLSGVDITPPDPGSPAESTRSFGSLFGDDDSPPPPQPPPPPPPPPQQAAEQNIFLASSMDGTIRIWDRRVPTPVGTSHPGRGTPPWCMSAIWSTDGNFFYAGRRNGCVEEYSIHKGVSQPVRPLKFPLGSGSVTAMTAMPNGRHIVCASYDNLRLWDLKWEEKRGGPTTPFLIIPGHHGGVVSHLYADRTCRYLISTAGNRGWEGANTEVLLGYEISW